MITSLLLITAVSASDNISDTTQVYNHNSEIEKTDYNIPIYQDNNIENNIKTSNSNKNKNVKQSIDTSLNKENKNLKSDIKTHINLTAEDRYVYQSTRIFAYLYDENNKPIDNQEVILTFNDSSYGPKINNTTDLGKVQDTEYSSKIPGEVTVTATYNGNATLGYGPSSNSTTFTVYKYNQNIIIEPGEAMATRETLVNLTNDNFYHVNASVFVNDSLGNILYDDNVTFINQKANFTFTAQTNQDITINVSVKNHSVLEDISRSITIPSALMPTNTTISAPATIALGKKLPVTITVKDAKGNIVKRGTGRVLVNNSGDFQFDAKDSIVNYTMNVRGKVPVKVEYDGLENVYAPSVSNEVWVEVQSFDTSISITAMNNMTAHTDSYATVKLTNGDNVLADEDINIKVTQDNNQLDYSTAKLEDGRINITFVPLTNSSVNITAEYAGSDIYNPSNKSIVADVSNMKTSLTVSVANVAVNDTLKVNITLKDANGKKLTNKQLKATVNGQNRQVIEKSNGEYYFEFASDKKLTNANVAVTFTGSEGYASSENNTQKFNVTKIPTTLEIKVDNNVINNFTATITISSLRASVDEGTVTLYANNKQIAKQTVSNPKVTLTNTTMLSGNYTLKAVYTGVDVYGDSQNTIKTATDLINTTLKLELLNKSVKVNESVSLKATLTNGSTPIVNQEVQFVFNDSTVLRAATDKKGQAVVNYTNTNESKKVSVYAKFDETSMYKKQNTTTDSFAVDKINTSLKLEVLNKSVNINESVSIKATLSNGSMPIANEQVQFVFNDSSVLRATTDKNGQVTVKYTDTSESKKVSVYAKFDETSTYKKQNTTLGSFVVNKLKTTTTASILNNMVDNVTVNVTVKSNNTTVKSGNLKVVVDGAEFTRKVNATGQTVIPLNITRSGKIPVTVTFIEDNVYAESQALGDDNKKLTSIDVIKQQSKVTVDVSKSSVDVESPITISGTLTYANNKKISNAPLTINIATLTVTTKTDTDGTYSFEYTTNKENTYEITVIYAGNDTNVTNATAKTTFNANKIKTTTNIKVLNNTTDDTRISIQVKDAYGKILTTGNIDLVVNNNTYDVSVNKTGTTIVKLDADAGSYNITAKYVENSKYSQSNQSITINTNKIKTTTKITVLNNTAVDSRISIQVKDAYGNVITSGDINLTVNENSFKVSVNKTGTTIVTLDADAGSYKVNAKYIENNKYLQSRHSITLNVLKINATIKLDKIKPVNINQSYTVKASIVDTNNKTVKEGTVVLFVDESYLGQVNVTNGSITYTNKSIYPGNYTLVAIYTNSNNYNDAYDTTVLTVNILQTKIKLDKINPVKVNQSYTIKASVVDANNRPVKEGTVLLYNNGSYIGHVNVTNGSITYTNKSKYSGNYAIAAIYTNSYNYNDSYNATTLTVNKLQTTIKIDNLNVTVGDNATFNIHVTDEKSAKVNGGKVVLKVNGVSLTDAKNNPIQAQVVNGLAKITYKIPLNWTKSDYNISAVYGGTTNTYESSRSSNYKLTTKLRTANLTLTITPKTNKMDKISTLTAKITDNKQLVNGGVVIFKINGQTIKDKNGKSIQVNVVNGTASYNYTLPDGLKAGNYNITAVYAHKNYNRAQINATLTAVRANIHYNVTVSVKNRVMTIKGKQLDEYNHTTIGNNIISVKLSGISIKNNNSPFQVTSGIININFTIPVSYKANEYELQIITGKRYAYNTQKYTKTIKIE